MVDPSPVVCRIAQSVGRSFLNYLHLYNFLRRRVSQSLSSRPLRVVGSTREFWDGVRREDIRAGDQVEFRDAFVTEWIPRLPGVASNREGAFGNGGSSRSSIADILAMESAAETVEDPGAGAIRLANPDRSSTTIPLSITTPDAWLVDLGIPVQVSAAVYSSFRNRMKNGCAATDRLRAMVVQGPLHQFDANSLKSIGSMISDSFMEKLTTPLGIPAVHLDLVSPLDVHFQHHDSHPPGFLWAIVRSRHSMRVVHHLPDHPDRLSPDARPTVSLHPVAPYIHYTRLTSRRQLDSVDDVDEGAAAFQRRHAIIQPGQPDPARHGVDQIEVLTEFDLVRRRFTTSIPIEGLHGQAEDVDRAARVLSDLQRARPK